MDKFWASINSPTDFTFFAEMAIIKLGGNITKLKENVTESSKIKQLIDDFVTCLNQKRCLLVIDNLESLLDKDRNCQDEGYKEFFYRWKKQGKNSTLLLTTQDIPKSLEKIDCWYYLEGMKVPEGVAFLQK